MSRSGSASLDRERADLRPAKLAAVAAERLGDRSNVGARGDEQVEPDDASRVALEEELVDDHAAHRHLDHDAAAVQPIGALPVDLHGRDSGNRQLNGPAQRFKLRFELALARRFVLLDDLPFRIAGRRRRGEVDLRHIALVEPDEARLQTGRRS